MKRYTLLRAVIALSLALVLSAGAFQITPAVGVEAASAKLNAAKKTLYIGKTYQLKVKNSKQTFSWKSSAPSVAKVSTSGLVTAVKKGTATITAVSSNGKISLTCRITVKKPYVTPSKVQVLSPGQTRQMGVKGAKAKKFTSSDPSVASIDSKTGLLTALKGSDYYVVVSVKCDNGKTYKRNVCVVDFGFDFTDPDDNSSDNSGSTDPSDSDPAGSGTPAEYLTVPSIASDKWGLFNPQSKTPVRTSFDYTITTKQEFLDACLDAYENCAPKFTIKFTTGNAEDWIDFYILLRQDYSMLSGYENNVGIMFDSSFWDDFDIESIVDPVTGDIDMSRYPSNPPIDRLTIKPVYKESHKASVALKHTGFDPGTEAGSVLSRCQKIVEKAIVSSTDLRGTILAINNEICRMTTYDQITYDSGADPYYTDGSGTVRVVPAYDATGVLDNGKAVCEGYSAIFRLCMDILGVPCHSICNSPATHLWTRVMLDGAWYHVDVTWNDACDNSFFLVTDSQLAALDTTSHTIDHTYLP